MHVFHTYLDLVIACNHPNAPSYGPVIICNNSLTLLLNSTVDKKPPDDCSSDFTSVVKLPDPAPERLPARRLGIRDLPMPPMASDADDDVDEDENDGVTEQETCTKDDDWCDSIVKSFFKKKESLSSRTKDSQPTQEQYVLTVMSCCRLMMELNALTPTVAIWVQL